MSQALPVPIIRQAKNQSLMTLSPNNERESNLVF